MQTDNARPLIQLTEVTKVFRAKDVETHALSEVSLEIFFSEFVSIVGPSGCGKSTLLSILGLLDTPSRGEYLLNSRSCHNLSTSEKGRIRNRSIGFIFQAFNLIGDMTVLENVELPLRYRGLSAGARRLKAQEALEKVDMIHRMRHYPNQLSGGQQQRVAVARAISGEPPLILADEPTGNLDSNNAAEIMEILCSLNRMGSTICMVTHNPAYLEFSKKVIRLLDGKIVSHL